MSACFNIFLYFSPQISPEGMHGIQFGNGSYKILKINNKGEVQEWLNWHAWKACVPLKGTEGSNPSLSANF